MKAFHTIAVPHDDIIEGRLTMDVFAADLWEVFKGRGPDEYKAPDQFFRKTYETQGLKNLLEIVEKRLNGRGGDPVIQIQTPFGGGKTHALIAMYHKAEEWRAKKIVLVGTALGPRETLWGVLEQQLTGKVSTFGELASPGREALHELLGKHQPVLILMDEVLEYVTKAAATKVGESTLAAQSVAFLQELTEVAGTLGKVCLVITLPSSILEHYDERAERLFQQLQKVAGRVEKIYTPVQEHEITSVVRQRLFSDLDRNGANQIVQEFVDYVVRESLLPPGAEPSDYRRRFEAAYPFVPEVVDVLYHRWGSFSSFQRTRGVLRLLALVLQSTKDGGSPYLTLADFNLENTEIRRELLKHIGNEFDSVIAADITDAEAGARKVDGALGRSYLGLHLGTRAATTIFMHSFSGGPEKGALMGEIKRTSTTVQNPSSVVAEAVEQLKGKLFFLQHQNGKYFFTNQPNLNRMLLQKMENIDTTQLTKLERELLGENIAGRKLKPFLWPEKNSDLPDDQDLKLVILKQHDPGVMRDILENKGENPRVNRNTVFFLTPKEGEKPGFENALRKYLGYEQLLGDKTLNLSADQRKEIKAELDRIKKGMNETLRRYYRQISIPSRSGLKEEDLGIPTYGERRKIDGEVYEKLRSEGEILEQVVPLVIKEKYLRETDHVSTEQIYTAGLTAPGETRVTGRGVWERGIAEGVRQGLFGLGDVEDGEVHCRYFREEAPVGLSASEVIIREEICARQMQEEVLAPGREGPSEDVTGVGVTLETPGGGFDQGEVRDSLRLTFSVPRGRVSALLGMLNFLQEKFATLKLTLSAENGRLSEQEYDDKIKETFRQLGIEGEEDE